MITPDQRERRRQYMGSSDTPIALGMRQPYRTPADLQLEKLGLLEPETDALSLAAELGNELEPFIVRKFFAKTRMVAAPADMYVSTEWPFLAANLDAGTFVDGHLCPVECKASADEDWGPTYLHEDGIPQYVHAQLCHQMAVLGSPMGWVAALVFGKWGSDFRIYEVKRDDEVVRQMADWSSDWWQTHVVESQPIRDSIPTLDVLKRRRRTPDKSVEQTDASPYLRWDYARQQRLEMEKVEESAKCAAIAAAGDAEEVVTPAGWFTFFRGAKGGRVARWKGRRS